MTREDVDSHGGLRVGQEVLVTEECGFDAGRVSMRTVERITLARWTPEESRRLGVPPVERFLFFRGGDSAGPHDRVVPAPEARPR